MWLVFAPQLVYKEGSKRSRVKTRSLRGGAGGGGETDRDVM